MTELIDADANALNIRSFPKPKKYSEINSEINPNISSKEITYLDQMPKATLDSPNKINIDNHTYIKIALPFMEKIESSDPRYNSLRTTIGKDGNRYGRIYGYVPDDNTEPYILT